MKPWRLEELNYKTVKEAHYEVAILPIGATEPHNLHLPYGTDAITAQAVADQACAKAHKDGAKVVLLPTIPYGVDTNMMQFPLAMNVSMEAITIFIKEIIATLEHNKIHKLVIVNGHGGNDFKAFVRDMYIQSKVFISVIDWFKVPADQKNEIFDNPGDHADEMETSVGLHLFPELVKIEDADPGETKKVRFKGVNEGWVSITRPWHLLTTNSGVGDPRKGTKEKGKQFFEIAVDRIGSYILELSDAEMDDQFPFESQK